MKKIFWTFVAAVLSASVVVGYVAAAPKATELRVVTIYPVTHQSMNAFYMLRDRVNERAKGELVIKRIGGPETIGMFDQAQHRQGLTGIYAVRTVDEDFRLAVPQPAEEQVEGVVNLRIEGDEDGMGGDIH